MSRSTQSNCFKYKDKEYIVLLSFKKTHFVVDTADHKFYRLAGEIPAETYYNEAINKEIEQSKMCIKTLKTLEPGTKLELWSGENVFYIQSKLTRGLFLVERQGEMYVADLYMAFVKNIIGTTDHKELIAKILSKLARK